MAKKEPKNPVSIEDADLFHGLMQRWLEQLNMSDWRLVRQPRPSTEMAEIVSQDTNHRLIRYRIGRDFGSAPVNLETLENTAIHEVLHCRFHEMLEAAYTEGEYNERVQAAEHSTIIVMTNLLHDLMNAKRELAKLKGVS
jgi:hypothetical protein